MCSRSFSSKTKSCRDKIPWRSGQGSARYPSRAAKVSCSPTCFRAKTMAFLRLGVNAGPGTAQRVAQRANTDSKSFSGSPFSMLFLYKATSRMRFAS